MRILAIAALTITMFLAALSSPSPPNATTSLSTIDGVTASLHAMPSTVDMKSLPQ